MQNDLYLTSQISNLNKYAVIVAGGTGTRMQSAVPKQFLLLNGKPVLMHTIENFFHAGARILLVLHPEYHGYWKALCTEHHFDIPHLLIGGGETRFHSVKNSLEHIQDDALVAVQDAVRPITSAAIIEAAYQSAARFGNGVIAVKSRDSVRQLINGQSTALNREGIYLVQTPQTFNANLLKRAYKQEYMSTFTDDASVVEQLGETIKLVEGDYRNLKITFPEDIAIAELLIQQKSRS